MWSWLIIVLGLVASGYFTDVHSESNIQAIVCPIMFAILIITSLIKVLLNSSAARSGANGTSFGGGGLFGGDSGSSGGDCSGGGGDC